MRKVILASLAMLCVVACEDKAEERKQELAAAVSSGGTKQKAPANTFTDPRNNQTYRVVTIGQQTWMAENLNFETPIGSYCYNGDLQYCQKYGRLYSPTAAKTACPAGWHLPSNDEWITLFGKLLDPAKPWMYTGASKLKAKGECPKLDDQQRQAIEASVEMATSQMSEEEQAKVVAMLNSNCTDDYGFSVLPAGNTDKNGQYVAIGKMSAFFGKGSVSENTLFISFMPTDMIQAVDMPSQQLTALSGKGSVRCVKD